MEQSEVAARISNNLARVRQSIADSAGGREVRLVCVTKYASVEWAAALLEAGATELGENLLPDGAEKFAALRSRGYGFTAHLLGPLQSRKAKLCAESCDWYQALEKLDTAQRLTTQLVELGKCMDVLIEINISGEPSKHGLPVDQVGYFIGELLAATDNPERASLGAHPGREIQDAAGLATRAPLHLRGLMCVPAGPEKFASAVEYERATRGAFRQMAALFARMQAEHPQLNLDTLSMGMSADFPWAIAEGANMVRIGSALFEGLSS